MFKRDLEQGLAMVFHVPVKEYENLQERLCEYLYYTVLGYDVIIQDETSITFTGQILVELEKYNNGEFTYGLISAALHEYSKIPTLKEFQLESTDRSETVQAISESARRISKVLDFTITQDYNRMREVIKCLELNFINSCNSKD